MPTLPFRSFVLLTILVATSLPLPARAQIGAMGFLTYTPSPAMKGMGGALTAAAMDDPLSTIYNPGCLGLSAGHTRFAGTAYIDARPWINGGPNGGSWNEIHYSTRAVQVGVSAAEISKWAKQPFPFSFGVGFNETYLDLGESGSIDSDGGSAGSFHSYERGSGVTFALGSHTWFDCGIGWTTRYVIDHRGYRYRPSSVQTYAYDLGVVTQWPLITERTRWAQWGHGVRPFFTPNLSYAMTNIGSGVRYTDDPGDKEPLARTGRLSASVRAGITQVRNGEAWELLTVELARQEQDELLAPEQSFPGYHYTNPFGRMRPLDDLIFGNANRSVEVNRGFELGAAEILYLRWGAYQGLDGSSLNLETDGLSLRLGGVFKLMRRMQAAKQHESAADYLMKHLDLVYSESHWKDSRELSYDQPATFDGVRHHSLSLYWR